VAILYALKLWPALLRYCDDGAIEIDNSAPNAPCAAWRLAVATTYSPAPTAAATAPPRSTRWCGVNLTAGEGKPLASSALRALSASSSFMKLRSMVSAIASVF
jgi:hypothetical protein